MMPLSRETKLLLTCVRAALRPAETDIDELKSLLAEGLDWRDFLFTTLTNRVTPLVWSKLAPLEQLLPKHVAKELRLFCTRIMVHHATNIQEVKRLGELLQQNGIPYMPLKGPTLGTFYERAALREWSDLDILLRREDVERFDRILPLLGYEPGQQEEDQTLAELLQTNHAYNIVKKDRSVRMDVHWKLCDEEDDDRYPVDIIWKHSRVAGFYDFKALQPDFENQLFYTCLHHGLREGWDELRFVADWMILLNKAADDTDWEEMLKTAKSRGIRRAFLVGTALTQQLLNNPIPDYLSKQIQADRQIEKALRYSEMRMFRGMGPDPKFDFNGAKRLHVEDNMWRAKWLLAKRYLSPNASDKATIALPEPLHFLYYAIRPLRLIRKYGASLFARR